MAKVSYDPKADDTAALPENTTQFGYEFNGTKPVDVDNPAHLRKFAAHPHFKVSGTVPDDSAATVRTAAERESVALGAEKVPRAKPLLPQPEPGPAKVTPGQADKPDGDSGLRAVHKGHGAFSVVQGDDGEEALTGLTKEEAEEFNNLSATAKAAYLAKYAK
jgi:hypothetical protein